MRRVQIPRTIAFHVCVLALVCASPVLAQTGTVSGTITNAANSAALSGVTVSLINSSGGTVTTSPASNGAGAYTTPAVPAGNYFVRTNNGTSFVNKVHNGAPAGDVICYIGCSPQSLGTPVVVSGTVTIDFALSPGGGITGTITNSTNASAIANVSVQIQSAGSTGSAFNFTTTNGSGVYTLNGVAPGNYVLRTLNSQGFLDEVSGDVKCFGCQFAIGTPVTVPAPGGTTPAITLSGGAANFALDPAGFISGNLNLSPDSPLNANVTLYNASGLTTLVSFAADASGNYKTSGLPPGTYYLRALGTSTHVGRLYPDIPCVGCSALSTSALAAIILTGEPLVIVDATTQLTNKNFTLPVGGTITGTVSPPVSGMTLAAYTLNGTAVTPSFPLITTNGAGAYTIGPLESGSYQVAVTGVAVQNVIEQLYFPPTGKTCLPCTSPTGGTPVAVTLGAATPSINFTLATGGQITGTVTNVANGNPVASATVRIVDQSSTSTTLRQTTTNGAGVYTVSGLPSSTYFAVTSASTLGFIDEVFNNVLCIGCSPSLGQAIPVTAGAVVSAIDFALAAGGQITGQVTDGAVPLASLAVSAVPQSGIFNGASATTDSSGNYAFKGLPDGTYFVRTTAPSSRGFINEFYDNIVCPLCPIASGTPIIVTGASTESGKSFALAPGGSIAGVVTNAATSAPIAGITVSVNYSNGTTAGSAVTDDLGRYSVGGLASGSYFVVTSQSTNPLGFINELYNDIICVSCATTGGTPVTVTAPTATTGINFALASGGRVTGKVTNDAGTPVPLADVTVTIFSGTASFATAKTNASGDFVVNGLPTGTYTAKTTNSQGYIEELFNNIACLGCLATTGTTFGVTAGVTTANINFALTKGGVITGKVTDAVTSAPIQFVTVSISDGFTTLSSVSTNSAGYYTSSGLPAGNYFVRTSFNSAGYINMLHKLPNDVPCAPCSAATGTTVAVGAAGSSTTVDFALPKGGSIEGTITRQSNGTPIPSVTVSVYTTGGSFLTSATSAGNGKYAVRGLPTDNYFALTTNGQGFINEVYDNLPCTSCVATTGTLIPVTAGVATLNRDFELAGGAVITGTVTSGVTPLSGIPVQVYSNTGQNLSTATTNSAGAYQTSAGLQSGTYFLRTANSSGYIDVLYDSTPCIGCVATSGTPVSATAGSTTPNINFNLAVGGTITGTVVGAGTLTPLSGVSVTIFTAEGRTVKTVTTNVAGFYSAGGLAGGSYFVRTANGLGFIDQLYNGKSAFGPIGSGTPVAVTAGATTAGIDFTLPVGGRILGHIARADNPAVPLSNVTVQVFDATGFGVGNGFTNGVGDYITRGLATGTYYVKTSNTQGFIDEVYNNVACQTCALNGTPISVTAGANTTGIDFLLALGGRISGVVKDASTLLPIANATVQPFSSTGEGYPGTATGSNGQFITSSGLPTGTYFVKASSRQGYITELYDNKECPACAPLTGTPVPVTAGATFDLANEILLAKGGLISGKVTATTGGAPIAGVNVAIFNNINIGVSGATTDSDGNYLITSGLPTGTYYARTGNNQGFVDEVYNNASLNAKPNEGTGIPVTVGATTANIDFALDNGGRISGHVTDSGTGLPLKGIRINIADATGKFVNGAQTDDAGAYVTGAGLPAGNYFVLTNNSQGYIDKLYANTQCLVCDPTLGAPVAVTAGATTPNIDFALGIGGRISGTITSTDTTQPIFGVGVQVYTSTGAPAGAAGTNGLGNYITNTGLPAGSYFVRTFNLKGFIDELFASIACAPCPPLTGTPIAVTVGATTPSINFALDTGGLVSGYVVDSVTSAPIAGVTVSFYLQPGNTYAGTSRPTDANGYFAISLPVGTYIAQPDAVNGYVQPSGSSATAAAVGSIQVDRGGESGGVIFPLAACTPPSLTPATLGTVTKGLAASITLNATGANAPYIFSVSDGTLTPGLSLSTTGGITGTPTTLGTATFTIAAVGANGCSGTTEFNQLTCGASFSQSGASFTSTGGSGAAAIATTTGVCNWSVSGGASWITVTGAASGQGIGSVGFQVAANPGPASRSATLTLGGQSFLVTQGGATTTAPFGLVETPSDGAAGVTGSIGVTGWALDDLQISSVEIWRDPVPGETPGQEIFIGTAVLVDGARPDVQALYPALPFSSRAGWGYLLLTNFLPNQGNGLVKLNVYARDLEGKITLLGSRTITTANATATTPFGAIDTPGQGATVSGNAYINFGWALTPQPKTIPIDGSTITVFIDGAPVGTVNSYNNPRPDIQALFPGYNNTNGAVGVRFIDTTLLADGVHTIAWVAFDDAGAGTGIGSRFFAVNNGGGSLIASPRAAAGIARGLTSAVIANPPTHDEAPSAEGVWNADAASVIAQRPLDRVEVSLGASACGAWTAYRVVDGRLQPLPFGASVDGNTFYWQPGVGYLGTYDFVFVSCGGSQTVSLRVVLQP